MGMTMKQDLQGHLCGVRGGIVLVPAAFLEADVEPVGKQPRQPGGHVSCRENKKGEAHPALHGAILSPSTIAGQSPADDVVILRGASATQRIWGKERSARRQ